MILERRVDVFMWIGASFVAGWVCCQAYYGVTALWQKQHLLQQTVVVTQKHAACEHRRATVATTTAEKSEAGKDVDLSIIPSCPEPASKSGTGQK